MSEKIPATGGGPSRLFILRPVQQRCLWSRFY